MWQAQYETTTDVPAEKLFRAITDINVFNPDALNRRFAPCFCAQG